MILEKYSNFLAQKKGLRERLEHQKKDTDTTLKDKKQTATHLKEAREIMNVVGILAQNEVKTVIEELVTQALQSVFDKSYSFVIENKILRNKPETNFYVEIDGKQFSLKEELGGGIVDIVSFSLRIVLWALKSPRSANTIILDEPGKFISKDLIPGFGEMIKRLSEMLGLQFIIVSHEQDLIDAADTAYVVHQKNGISIVEKV